MKELFNTEGLYGSHLPLHPIMNNYNKISPYGEKVNGLFSVKEN